ncbi:MAG: DUF2871 domain-containing protein [Acutalibacter sp.]|nr:DUF2871 domain-containing protein [Acutalibacter sp.]
MRKYINISFIYAIAAIVCGVFYREFTKLTGFSGKTTLAFTHLHMFVLGMAVFLIIAVFSAITDLTGQKQFKPFMLLYNTGLPFMVAMLFARGIPQALEIELSPGASAAISGMAGIAHIMMTTAVILLFMALRNSHITARPSK